MESLSDMPTVKYREIYRDLKQNILSGKLQTDGALPSQAELTKRYGVATGTVRQSLSALQAEGLIRAVHGKGFFAKKPQINERPTRIIQAVLMDRMDVLGSLTSDVLHGASQGARELGGSVSILPMTISESDPLLQSELAIDDQSRLLFWGFVNPSNCVTNPSPCRMLLFLWRDRLRCSKTTKQPVHKMTAGNYSLT